MSRIPNEGLKPGKKDQPPASCASLNEQNPERGIETSTTLAPSEQAGGSE